MNKVAVFLWQKKSPSNICTFIFDKDELKVHSSPKKFTFTKKIFSFKKEVKSIINEFNSEIIKIYDKKSKIYIEYKIVFPQKWYSWLKPAAESKVVYHLFIKSIKQLQKQYPNVILQPQLRRKLSGKALWFFKRALRKMQLVSRKKNTNYEYHLWMLGLHATKKSHESIINTLKQKVMDNYWNQS